jgi:hypothetical protein
MLKTMAQKIAKERMNGGIRAMKIARRGDKVKGRVREDEFASLLTPRSPGKPPARFNRVVFWSAATRRRFGCRADLSARQNRVERFAESDATRASRWAAGTPVRAALSVDGDESPAESAVEPPHSKAAARKGMTGPKVRADLK